MCPRLSVGEDVLEGFSKTRILLVGFGYNETNFRNLRNLTARSWAGSGRFRDSRALCSDAEAWISLRKRNQPSGMDDEAQAETEAETDTEAPSDGCRRHRIIRSRAGSQQQQLTPESGKPNRKRTEHGPRLLPLSACPKASRIPGGFVL